MQSSKVDKVLAKHEQVERLRLERIANGEAQTGASLPSKTQLLRDLKVSRTGLGHRLRSTESRPAIAVIYSQALFGADLAPFFSLQIDALRRELERRSCTMRAYALELGKSSWDTFEQLQRDSRRGLLAGVLGLHWPSGPGEQPEVLRRDAELMRHFREAHLPFTAITGQDVPAAVGLDYEAVGFLGTEYFLARGLHDVALMTCAYESEVCSKRTVSGYRRALKAHGVKFHADRVMRVGSDSEQNGYQTFKAWWPRAGKVKALVIDDDRVCKGVMIAALELGVAIPKQLALAALSVKGCHTFFPCPSLRLETNPDVTAREAINRLLDLIADPDFTLPPLRIKPRIGRRAVAPVRRMNRHPMHE